MTRIAIVTLAAMLGTSGVLGAQPVAQRIEADGPTLKVTLNDGRVLTSPDLVGAVLTVRDSDGVARRIKLAGLSDDPRDRSRTIKLHDFRVEVAPGEWRPYCQKWPADGTQAGIPMATADGGFELVCTAGSKVKCVRFGYAPWATGPDGQSLKPLWEACNRMVRADYGGQGEATTLNGRIIDMYDTQGIQTPDYLPDHGFEAGWAPDGAVCVNHVRVKQNTSLAALEARYPRLKGRTGSICTEEFARAHGAILFNRSKM
ncbi:MAG: ADYC domain-containing protein [Reyranellaceae bacterium]